MNGEMNRIVIGIDQSYKDSGIAISVDGRLKVVTDCYIAPLKSNTEKRKALRETLNKIFEKMAQKAKESDTEIICIIERIRLHSGKNSFISIDYIKSIGALNSLIVDLAHVYGISVYSVETRAWKAAIVGTTKSQSNPYGFDEKKWPTIVWCVAQGYKKHIIEREVSKRKKKAVIEKGKGLKTERYTYNDNRADAICLSLYGFVDKPKLQEER